MSLALTWIWCVGVFHLVVAAAAFEMGITWFVYFNLIAACANFYNLKRELGDD